MSTALLLARAAALRKQQRRKAQNQVVMLLEPRDEWDRRLLNWARYKFGVGSVQISGRPNYMIATYGTADRYREATMPILVAEAQETDRLVSLLPEELRPAVRVWYCEQGSRVDQAQAAGCRDRYDLARRVERAKKTLDREHSKWLKRAPVNGFR